MKSKTYGTKNCYKYILSLILLNYMPMHLKGILKFVEKYLLYNKIIPLA